MLGETDAQPAMVQGPPTNGEVKTNNRSKRLLVLVASGAVLLVIALTLVLIIQPMAGTSTAAAAPQLGDPAGLARGQQNCDVAIVGQGVGGVYAAWRITQHNQAAGINEKVCAFDALPEIGGSWCCAVQLEDDPLTLFTGAYRWNTDRAPTFDHLMTHFDIPRACWYPDCNGGDPPAQDRFLRDTLVPKNSTTSDDLPYIFRDSEKWGPGHAREHAPEMSEALFAVFPWLPQNIGNLMSGTRAEQRALLAEGRAAMDQFTYNGAPLNEVSMHHVLHDYFSDEMARYLLDLEGGYFLTISHMRSFFLTMMNIFTNDVFNPNNVWYKVDAMQEEGKRGFIELADRMRNAANDAGLESQYNHELTGVYHKNNKFSLTFNTPQGRKEVKAGKVILNLPPGPLNNLEADSIIFNEDCHDSLRSFRELIGHKVYLRYPTAWWKVAGLDAGYYATTQDPVQVISYHDGSTICTDPADPSTCEGWLQVSYNPFGTDSFVLGASSGMNRSHPYKIFHADDVSDHNIIRTFHEKLKQVHASQIPNWDAVVPEPTHGLISLYGDFLSATAMSRPTANIDEKCFLRPAPGLPIWMAQLSLSPSGQGFAEASIIMSERAVREMGYGEASFIDPDYYGIHTDIFNV